MSTLRPPANDLEQEAMIDALRLGCTCDTIGATVTCFDGVNLHVHVSHETDDCPAIARNQGRFN